MTSSLLETPETIPLQPCGVVERLGRLLVIAPHPDDESLGCGGLIALARRAQIPVRVLFMTDGTRSHPGSRRYPAERLRRLREQEARTALRLLAAGQRCAVFLGWPDGGGQPEPDDALFDEAVARCLAEIERFAPSTIVTPWRREAHPDHRASTGLIRQAVRHATRRIRVLEYAIWAWEQGGGPQSGEMTAWRLDIRSVLPQKLDAIAAHRSQVSDLIDDDPDGFRLTPQTLAHFSRGWELFLEDGL